MAISFDLYQQELKQVIVYLQQDLNKIRSGKASVTMLDAVNVEAYGSVMKISELATISTPDPHLLVITPWDRSLLPAIEKSILQAQLNLNPVIDGQIIRIVISELNQERRLELVKMVKQRGEQAKVALRNKRTEYKKEIESQKGISEDQINAQLEKLEKLVKDFVEQIELLIVFKENELIKI